jgi:nucleoside-diphosphate-sugar epimerase
VRVLVTGATGFVGSHLVDALVARGDDVLALARRPEQHEALRRAGARPVPGSLDDVAGLTSALVGVHTVYHLAGLTAARNEAEFLAVNEGGTLRLLELTAVAAPSARFIYVSSQAALGPSPSGTRLAEDAPCRPVTSYGRSKLAGEAAVRASRLPWTIVRPPAVYGPRDREFLRLFRLARWGLAPVFGTGTQEYSLVYVADLVDALVRAGTTPAAAGRTYHVAHDAVVLSRDIARAAGAALGRRTVLLPVPIVAAAPIVTLIGWAAAAAGRPSVLSREKLAEFLAPSWLVSSDAARRDLGWTAATGLAEGMRKSADWYRAEGWL